jgi:hypothetical protein
MPTQGTEVPTAARAASTASEPATNAARHKDPAPATPISEAAPVSRSALWTGRALSTLAILFLLLDAVLKLVKPVEVVEGTSLLGYPESVITGLGITLLVCTILYIVPRTTILGAVLLTAYMGGAIATHVRVENPLITHILFPTYLAAIFWGGLYLREPRLRQLLPFIRAA